MEPSSPKKPAPPGWPRISSSLYYPNAAEAIEWLCKAFGFEVRIRIEAEDGTIEHSELTYGTGLIMVGESTRRARFPMRRAPSEVGGVNTQNMMAYVDDVQAHFEQAVRAGAKVLSPPETTDYGPEFWTDRGYECEDPAGHRWWFIERLRTCDPQHTNTPNFTAPPRTPA